MDTNGNLEDLAELIGDHCMCNLSMTDNIIQIEFLGKFSINVYSAINKDIVNQYNFALPSWNSLIPINSIGDI